jgi:hypothetical protein
MTHFVSIVALLLYSMALTPFLAHAAIKQLTVQERIKYARHVFVGTVTSVEYKDIDRAPQFPEWITRHYKCVVLIDRVVKTSKHSRPNPSHPADETVEGPQVHVMAWRGTGRPAGFVGDSGSSVIPLIGNTYVFYTQFLHPDPQLRSTFHESYPHVADEELKAYNTLVPNGIGAVAELLSYEEGVAHTDL